MWIGKVSHVESGPGGEGDVAEVEGCEMCPTAEVLLESVEGRGDDLRKFRESSKIKDRLQKRICITL